jgi:DNA-binding response OmpR family regulator
MRILLIDDEEDLVSTIAERLGFRGIEADWACTPEDAYELAGKNDYDIAVVDVKMHGITGFEVKTELEKISPKLSYIFLTGHGSEHNFKKGCEEAGLKYYLIKPVNIDKLISIMNDLYNEKD